jgi:hypothetical protein
MMQQLTLLWTEKTGLSARAVRNGITLIAKFSMGKIKK